MVAVSTNERLFRRGALQAGLVLRAIVSLMLSVLPGCAPLAEQSSGRRCEGWSAIGSEIVIPAGMPPLSGKLSPAVI